MADQNGQNAGGYFYPTQLALANIKPEGKNINSFKII